MHMIGDFKKYKTGLLLGGQRVLGFDFGEVGIGVAISDAGLVLASPYVRLENKSYAELMPKIARIIELESVGLVVIGFPFEMSGREGKAALKTRAFADTLSSHLPDIEIVFIDERLTSAAVEKSLVRDLDLSRAKRKQVIDKLSAAKILQQFLDIMNKD